MPFFTQRRLQQPMSFHISQPRKAKCGEQSGHQRGHHSTSVPSGVEKKGKACLMTME